MNDVKNNIEYLKYSNEELNRYLKKLKSDYRNDIGDCDYLIREIDLVQKEIKENCEKIINYKRIVCIEMVNIYSLLVSKAYEENDIETANYYRSKIREIDYNLKIGIL